MLILGIAFGGIAIVLVTILWLRLHPLIGLLLASIFVLAFTPTEILEDRAAREQAVRIHAVNALGFGITQPLMAGKYRLIDENRFGQLAEAAKVSIRRIPPHATMAGSAAADAAPVLTDEYIWYTSFYPETVEVRAGQWLVADKTVSLPAGLRWQRVGQELADGFASTFRRLGIPVSMAAIIGLCLLESGAASRLVQAIMSLTGKRGTGPALTASGFVLGVPVFFDNVFYLLLPLAKGFARSHPGAYITAVMAIVVGATMAHSLVPPTPGPLLVAGPLQVSIGEMMLAGFIVGSLAATAGYLYGTLCQHWIKIEEPALEPPPTAAAVTQTPTSQAAETAPQLSLGLAALPILLPIAIFGAAEILNFVLKHSSYFDWLQCVQPRLDGLSDPNVVFLLGALVAILVLRKVRDAALVPKVVARGLHDAGTIILITCAGGAFGKTLQQLELATVLSESFDAVSNPWGLLILAFTLTAAIRVAQGSATVAMITSVAIIAPIADTVPLPFHRVYLALAIGCGSKLLPWMNDSGFWQVATMTGMTPGQTFRSFSIALTLMGLVGFAVTLLGAWIIPLT
jgi:gluconate:H+ symporter, GntP family